MVKCSTWAPGDADGTWPCEAVREVIEITRSRRLESGLYIGVKNKRGTTNRGILDGGEQERDLGKRYRNYSDAVRFEWPRTSLSWIELRRAMKSKAKSTMTTRNVGSGREAGTNKWSA